jgi:hypothetical protein
MSDKEVEIRHEIDLPLCDGRVSVSNLYGSHMIVALSCRATIFVNFSNRKQMEDLSRALLDVANHCFPIESPSDKIFDATVAEGGLHEKGESTQ